MEKKIQLTIDNQVVEVPEGTTILKAADSVGIFIPTICFHEACTANALCRICVVEVEGARTLIPSCVAKVNQGMKVTTNNDRIRLNRRTILEMLASTVNLQDSEEILDLIKEYNADTERFNDAKSRKPELIDDNPMYMRDYEKCILCWRCVQVCAEDAQYTFAINFSGRGYHTQIDTFYQKPMPLTSCVFCGQCVGVCPTGALKPKKEWLLEQEYTPDEIMQLSSLERKKRTRPQPITPEGENE